MKTHYLKKINDVSCAIEVYERLIANEEDAECRNALAITTEALKVAKTHYEDMFKAVPQKMESEWIPVETPPEEGQKIICKGIRGGQYFCTYENGQFIEVGRKRKCKVKAYVHVPE